MSPSSFDGNYAVVFYVALSGFLYAGTVVTWNSPGVRPVINLRADVQLTGTGSQNDPFKVVGAE